MRVVVTGAAGFIGSALCGELQKAHDVLGVDSFQGILYSSGDKRQNAAELERIGVHVEELDLRTADLSTVLDGADAVVHLAALPGLVPSWTHYEEYLSCNVLGTARLVDAAVAGGITRFVHGSTSSVYGIEATGDENQPLAPVSPYGVTKLAAEEVVRAHQRVLGLPAVILRFFSVDVPGQRPDMAYHRFIEAALDGRPIEVFGDGHQTRSNTYISDCVSATLAALWKGEVGGAYNVGGGTEVSLLDAVDLIGQECGRRIEIDFRPPRIGDQRHTRAICQSALDELGFQPVVDPPDGIVRQVDWHCRRSKGK